MVLCFGICGKQLRDQYFFICKVFHIATITIEIKSNIFTYLGIYRNPFFYHNHPVKDLLEDKGVTLQK